MLDGIVSKQETAAPEEFSGRSDRVALLGFATDAATEATLREGLAGILQVPPDIRRANIRQAIVALQRGVAPSTLIVDLAGEAQPLAALEDLSQVVEPDVNVLVIGDRQDMDFYRRITRGLGVREYLFKPLTAEMVARHFGPTLGGRAETSSVLRGGRVITVIGARAGSGASTISANLAWSLGALANRHTLLLDPDLQTGTAALMLGMQATPALRAGLETPSRLDALYIGRAVQAASPRLDVLASEAALDENFTYCNGAAEILLDLLQRHYNFIVIDLPVGQSPFLRVLREHAHQSVIVLDPSLPAVRDTLRIFALSAGPRQVRRPLLVLNRAGAPGGLTTAQVTEALQIAPDIVIPYIGRRAREAELSGKPAVSARGPMRDAIAEIAMRAAAVRPAAVHRGFFGRIFR